MIFTHKKAFLTTLTVSMIALSGCSMFGEEGGLKTEAKYPTGADRDGSTDSIYDDAPSIFGANGLSIGGDRNKEDDNNAGIGVNSFLWRATLDTVSFMPLASADPFGGTILTDWYTPDATKGERFKLNVFILGRQLRSDGVRVRVFRQVLTSKGAWVDSQPTEGMDRQLEDTILTRARQLRVAQLD
jgi:hypothetical protein